MDRQVHASGKNGGPNIAYLMTTEELEGRFGGRISASRIEAWAEAEIIPHYELEGEKLFDWEETRRAINTNLLVRREANPVRVLSVKHCLPSEHVPPPTVLSRFSQNLVRLHLTSLGEAKWSGIYFLCLNGEVVYVGQTEGRISRRVPQHCDTKVFDSAFCIRLDPLDLDYVEAELIKELQPVYNIHGAHARLYLPCGDPVGTESGRKALAGCAKNDDGGDDFAPDTA